MRVPPDDILERADAGAPEGEAPPDLVVAWAPFPVEFGASWWVDEPGRETAEAEPALAFAWAPFPVEFGASWWADPAHPAEPEELAPPPRRRAPRLGLAGSLGVHLLPLLLLIGDTGAPPAAAGAIPVQLVVEQPETESASEAPAAKQRPPPVPQPMKTAAVAPPRVKPTPPPQPAAAPEPKPAPPPQPKPVTAAAPSLPQPNAPTPAAATAPARREAMSAPSAAAKSETDAGDYLARLVALTRRHADMLPPSFLAGRRGETILSVVVHDDGTILRIAVKHSSGYPDIDRRIAEMVTAVGRFPPPPQRYRRADLDLDFKLIFPYAVQQ